MKKFLFPFLAIVFLNIPFTFAQYQVKSQYLKTPDLILGYVDSCAAFWDSALDQSSVGGFFTNIDRQGNVLTSWGTSKDMISQSRNAYGLTRAFMMTGNETYLNLGQKGLDFMYKFAWDKTYGGWFNSISSTGSINSINGNKYAFYQHYALLGLVAKVEVTGDTTAMGWFNKGYQYNETVLWDSTPARFGYFNSLSRNGATRSGKTFNSTVDAITTHLLNMYLLTGEAKYKTRMLEVASNMVDRLAKTMDAQEIGFAENYNTDWTYNNTTANDNTRTIMGHVLKTAWCLGRVYQFEKNEVYLETAIKLADHVLAKGYDHVYGGPFKDYDRVTGTMLLYGQPDSAKAWWQMEQAITAGLFLHNLTGDDKYLRMADETLSFYMTHFVDHEYGEVYENKLRRGGFIWNDAKAGGGKAAYHSIETGYYVYLYGNLMLHKKPVTLYYKYSPLNQDRVVQLYPLEISSDQYRIKSVEKDGQTYSDFSSQEKKLNIPSGVNGVFKVVFESSTGVSVADNEKAVKRLSLEQNYPNPFNPVTKINYQVSTQGIVSLKVFDMQGREIRSLINEQKAPGTYSVSFDGAGLSSGIYLYQIKSGNVTETKRMLLLK